MLHFHFSILLPRMDLIFPLHSDNVEPSKHSLSGDLWLYDRGGCPHPTHRIQQQLSRFVTPDPHRAITPYPVMRFYYICMHIYIYMYLCVYIPFIKSKYDRHTVGPDLIVNVFACFDFFWCAYFRQSNASVYRRQ